MAKISAEQALIRGKLGDEPTSTDALVAPSDFERFVLSPLYERRVQRLPRIGHYPCQYKIGRAGEAVPDLIRSSVGADEQAFIRDITSSLTIKPTYYKNSEVASYEGRIQRHW
jgi:hypothetical protein